VSEWTLTIPADAMWINSNYRNGWRRAAQLTKSWRELAHWYAKAEKLPTGLARVHIEATLQFRDNRRRDVHNLMPTLKAVVDGLVDYGLIPDDSTRYLTGPDLRVGEKLPGGTWKDHGLLTLRITEAGEDYAPPLARKVRRGIDLHDTGEL